MVRVFGPVECALARGRVHKATCLLNLRFLDVVALSPFANKVHPIPDDCSPVAVNLRPFSNNLRPASRIVANHLHPSRRMIAIPFLRSQFLNRMIAGRYNYGYELYSPISHLSVRALHVLESILMIVPLGGLLRGELKMDLQYRQGDVLLLKIDKLPQGVVTVDPPGPQRVVLAYGEVTGHAHAVSTSGAALFKNNTDHYLGSEPGAQLVHAEREVRFVAA